MSSIAAQEFPAADVVAMTTIDAVFLSLLIHRFFHPRLFIHSTYFPAIAIIFTIYAQDSFIISC